MNDLERIAMALEKIANTQECIYQKLGNIEVSLDLINSSIKRIGR